MFDYFTFLVYFGSIPILFLSDVLYVLKVKLSRKCNVLIQINLKLDISKQKLFPRHNKAVTIFYVITLKICQSYYVSWYSELSQSGPAWPLSDKSGIFIIVILTR